MTECLGQVKIDFSMDWAFVMRKDQEDGLEIILHLSVQIELILLYNQSVINSVAGRVLDVLYFTVGHL